MRRFLRTLTLLLAAVLLSVSPASASFDFSDDRFRGVFTTENMDAIIEEYELLDGWYWTTRPRVIQTFHGQPDCPGWTDTAVNKYGRTAYRQGWLGCRWMCNQVTIESPTYGYGECFGFAQFIGYLLGGDMNPHHHWKTYYSVEEAGGLRVGDIIRVEYRAHRNEYHHSAIVYAVNGDEILFLQISSRNYNRISVGAGFSDGNHHDESSLKVISEIPGLKICRCPLNLE